MKNLEHAAGVQTTKITPTVNKMTTLSPQASVRNAALVRNQVHYNPPSPGPIGHCKAQTRSQGLAALHSCQTAHADFKRLYGLISQKGNSLQLLSPQLFTVALMP